MLSYPNEIDSTVVVNIDETNGFIVTINNLNLIIESTFDWYSYSDDEVKGNAEIQILLLTAQFDIVWSTKLDEGTGDYYPFMEIKHFAF